MPSPSGPYMPLLFYSFFSVSVPSSRAENASGRIGGFCRGGEDVFKCYLYARDFFSFPPSSMCPCCVASFILVPVSGHKRLRTNGRHVLRQMLPALSAMAVFEEALGYCWLAAIVADIGSVLSQTREVRAGIYLLRDLSPRSWLCNGKLSLTTAFVACGVAVVMVLLAVSLGML